MNFNNFIQRNQSAIQEFRKDKDLKDFILPETETKKANRAKTELEIKYEISAVNFKNSRDIWTREEVETLYATLDRVLENNSKEDILKLAISLERTRKAILWMHLHLFSDRMDLHRGKEVIAFRKELGLEKGEQYGN